MGYNVRILKAPLGEREEEMPSCRSKAKEGSMDNHVEGMYVTQIYINWRLPTYMLFMIFPMESLWGRS